MRKFRYLYGLVFILLICASCASRKKVAYFQEIEMKGEWDISSKSQYLVLSPLDKISIVVNSKEPTLSSLFNLPIVSYRITSKEMSPLSPTQQLSLYTIDEDGYIDFPVVGKIRLAGLTRGQVAKKIRDLLVEKSLVKDPTVIVEFANLSFSVLGEVNRPGRHSIDRDKLTLLDALGIAGDLTIYGKRENVLVIKEEDGVQKAYRVDLRSMDSLIHSPVYYIHQNDVIYVEPNNMRVGQSTVNGNSLRSSSFWLSLLSIGTTVTLFLLRK